MTWCKLHVGFPSTSHASPLRPAHWRRPRSKPPWCLHVARPPERRATRMQLLFSACTNPEGIDFLLPAQNVPWHQVRQGLPGSFFSPGLEPTGSTFAWKLCVNHGLLRGTRYVRQLHMPTLRIDQQCFPANFSEGRWDNTNLWAKLPVCAGDFQRDCKCVTAIS